MSNMNYERELKQAIAILYKTFACYPLNSQIEGCPCCVTEKDNQSIKSKPLNRLTASDLNHYAFNATLTWGTIRDLKHFLPRLLELYAFDENLFYGCFVVSRLSNLDWENWQKQERESVYQYLIALWQYILFQDPSSKVELADFLDCASDVISDFESLLSIWQNHNSINSLLHLSKFVQYEIEFNNSPVEIIHLSERNTKKILDWLIKSGVVNKLEKAFFDNINEPYAEELAIAVDIINCAVKSLTTSVEDI